MTTHLARRAVLFDLDGTLVDSAADLGASLNDILVEDSLAPLDEAEVRRMVGDGAAVLVERGYAARESTPGEDALTRFRERYDARCLEQTRCYEGIRDLLERLQRAAPARVIGVVTNKPTTFARKVIEGVGLAPLVTATVGPELARHRKPSPDHVTAALRLLEVRPDECVTVGDGTTDIASGRDAGTATIAVLWGYRTRAELESERPDAWAKDVAELQDLLLGTVSPA